MQVVLARCWQFVSRPWVGWLVAALVCVLWIISTRSCKPAPVVVPPSPVAEIASAAREEGRAEVHEEIAQQHAQAAASIEERIVVRERVVSEVRAEVSRALDSDGGIEDEKAADLVNRAAGW